MAVIKLVTNDDSTNQFRAVSLGQVVAVVFGLCSIIGAQQTWLWAGAHERAMLAAAFKEDIRAAVDSHIKGDESKWVEVNRRMAEHEDRLTAVYEHLITVERQVNINTGIIEHRYPR